MIMCLETSPKSLKLAPSNWIHISLYKEHQEQSLDLTKNFKNNSNSHKTNQIPTQIQSNSVHFLGKRRENGYNFSLGCEEQSDIKNIFNWLFISQHLLLWNTWRCPFQMGNTARNSQTSTPSRHASAPHPSPGGSQSRVTETVHRTTENPTSTPDKASVLEEKQEEW